MTFAEPTVRSRRSNKLQHEVSHPGIAAGLDDAVDHGFAEAIMRQVIHQISQSTGIERTVLQATPSGLALYEAMGYRVVTQFNVYISE